MRDKPVRLIYYQEILFIGCVQDNLVRLAYINNKDKIKSSIILDLKTKEPQARELIEDILSYCQLRILEKHRLLYALEGLPEFFSKNFQKQKKNQSCLQQEEENDYFDEQSIQDAQKIQESIQKEIDKNHNITVSHKYFPFQEKFPLFKDENTHPELFYQLYYLSKNGEFDNKGRNSILLKLLNQYNQKHPKSILKNNTSEEQEQVSGLINRSKASKSSAKIKPTPRKVSFMDQLDPKKNIKIFTYYPEEQSNFPPPPNENRLIPIDEEELRNIGIVFRKIEIEEEFSRKGSAGKKTVIYSQSIMEKLQKDLEKDRQDIEQQENTQKQNAMLRKQEKKEKKKEKKEAEEKKQQEEQNQKKENNRLERYQSQASGPLSLFVNQNDYYTQQLLDEQILKEIEKLQQKQALEQQYKPKLNEQQSLEQEQNSATKKISIPKINLDSVKKPGSTITQPDSAPQPQTTNNLQNLNNNIFKALQQLPPGIMKPPIVPINIEQQSDALESSHSFNELFSSRENTYRLQKK